MNADEAIKEIRNIIDRLYKLSDYVELYEDELEKCLKVIESSLIELKDKADYWDRVRVKKYSNYPHLISRQELENRSDLAGLAKWLDNG